MKPVPPFDPAPFDDQARERIWNGVERARLRSTLPTRRSGALALPLACVLAAAAFFGVRTSTTAHRPRLARAVPSAVAPAPVAAEPTPMLAASAAIVPSSSARSAPSTAPAPLAQPLAAEDALGRAAAFAQAAPPSVDELFAEADAARAAGRPGPAVQALDRIATLYPNDPRAGLALFTAGRIELDTLHQREAAARHLDRALQLGLPPGLTDDARARAAEAHAPE